MGRQKTEELELAFDTHCVQFGLPVGKKTHIFTDDSWFEIDRHYADYGVGVEINEELFHKQWNAQKRDAIKRNYCVIQGIPLLTFTGGMITDDPAKCMDTLRKALVQGGWKP